MPWRKVVDPVTGKSKFTNAPTEEEIAAAQRKPENAHVKKEGETYCDECDKKIEGRAISALEKTFHADCFACKSCNRQFEVNHLRYTVVDDAAVCSRCIGEADKAAGIVGKERTYYAATSVDLDGPMAFQTRLPGGEGGAAGGAFGGGGGGGDDPISLASVVTGKGIGGEAKQPSQGKCGLCGEEIEGMVISTKSGKFHERCFRCPVCEDLISADAGFTMQEGKPYHPECLRRINAPPCAVCGKPAPGKVYNVKGQRIHQECFVCAICSKSLAGGHLSKDGHFFCSSKCKNTPVPPKEAAGAAAAEEKPAQEQQQQQQEEEVRGVIQISEQSAGGDAAAPSGAAAGFCGSCGIARPGAATKFCGGCGTKFD